MVAVRAVLAWALMLAVLLPPAARADGVRIASRVDLGQLVARSRVILLATVRRVDHERRTTTAYGEARTWIATYRLEVEVDEFLRDGAHLDFGRGDRVWVHRGEPARPGKWALVEDFYPSGYDLARAQPGDRVVIFAHAGTLQPGKWPFLPVTEVDVAAKLDATRALVRKALARERAAWRKGARCKPERFWHEGRCRAPEQIAQGLTCPEGATVQHDEPRPGGLRVQCVGAAGPDGPSLTWGRAGYPSAAGARAGGERDGLWSFWDPAGRLERTTTYAAGRRHGPETRYHPSGRVACQGAFTDDLQDGPWVCFTEAGAEAGRFTLRRGTGLVPDWAPDGTPRRWTCHRRGAEAWATDDPAEAARRPCP